MVRGGVPRAEIDRMNLEELREHLESVKLSHVVRVRRKYKVAVGRCR